MCEKVRKSKAFLIRVRGKERGPGDENEVSKECLVDSIIGKLFTHSRARGLWQHLSFLAIPWEFHPFLCATTFHNPFGPFFSLEQGLKLRSIHSQASVSIILLSASSQNLVQTTSESLAILTLRKCGQVYLVIRLKHRTPCNFLPDFRKARYRPCHVNYTLS